MAELAKNRLKIPAQLRRRILIEAGHRCAIPTCRNIQVEVHHIVPWAKCKTHKYDNLIALCPNCHGMAKSGKIDRKSLPVYKANIRFAHDKYSQLEMDVLFELFALHGEGAVQWPTFMVIMLKRLLDSDLITFEPPRSCFIIEGLSVAGGTISITESGRSFVEALGVNEL